MDPGGANKGALPPNHRSRHMFYTAFGKFCSLFVLFPQKQKLITESATDLY